MEQDNDRKDLCIIRDPAHAEDKNKNDHMLMDTNADCDKKQKKEEEKEEEKGDIKNGLDENNNKVNVHEGEKR